MSTEWPGWASKQRHLAGRVESRRVFVQRHETRPGLAADPSGQDASLIEDGRSDEDYERQLLDGSAARALFGGRAGISELGDSGLRPPCESRDMPRSESPADPY